MKFRHKLSIATLFFSSFSSLLHATEESIPPMNHWVCSVRAEFSCEFGKSGEIVRTVRNASRSLAKARVLEVARQMSCMPADGKVTYWKVLERECLECIHLK